MSERYRRSFASDNNAIVHPKIMEALNKVNTGHCLSYGEDNHTEKAIEKFKEVLGQEIDVYLVYNGTAANVTGLASMVTPYQAIICSEAAHINVDECGAPQRFIGCRLLPLPTPDGKLRPEQIESTLSVIGVEHHSQPSVVSITQSTELGTIYSVKELKDLTDFAHRNNLLVHMDGARIANAAASLNVSLKEITTDVGIDVLSFGGTKNGLMFGEVVILFNKKLAQDYKYTRKQGMQLASKMRYIAVQFEALLSDDLWLKNAKQANTMAKLLASKVEKIPGIEITQPVESNGVFVTMPADVAKRLQQEYFFYPWNEEIGEYRWMTSFDMEEHDILDFVDVVKQAISLF
ncbi:MAG: low specificity L-threonine aldolase [Clostridiales bacterium]|nr:low specificity L-threonine aldolase [Clostridiales bacterium]